MSKDLIAPASPAAEKPTSSKLGVLNGGQVYTTASNRDARAAPDHSKQILDPKPSAALRDRLAAELREINSSEEAANWAHRVLSAKNRLTAADAARIEETFRKKVTSINTDTPENFAGNEAP